jgi:hypothetical protein
MSFDGMGHGAHGFLDVPLATTFSTIFSTTLPIILGHIGCFKKCLMCPINLLGNQGLTSNGAPGAPLLKSLYIHFSHSEYAVTYTSNEYYYYA